LSSKRVALNCTVVILGLIPNKGVWFCLFTHVQNIPEDSQVFLTGWFQLSISSSIFNKHFPYPYKRGLGDVELYHYTFSTKCPSWTSWFELKFVQIKSSYQYNYSHIVVYFGLFYCLIFSEMFNVWGITFFKCQIIPHTN